MSSRYICLTGGLGNQLFQYAALFSEKLSSEIYIDVVSGTPRVNKKGRAELLDLELEPGIHILENKMPQVTRRVLSLILRLHLTPKALDKIGVMRKISRIVGSFFVTVHFRKLIRVVALEDLGYDHKDYSKSKNVFLIGYFQSEKWISMPSRDLKLLERDSKEAQRIAKYAQIAKIEEPLIVHVRLGDYVAESGFGIPGTEYYKESIERQMSTLQYRKIWLFSDQPELAISRIPSEFLNETRVIDDSELSSAQTLEVMRLGKGYVIANSTFSYWGAILSYTLNPPVIYPQPWFKDVKPPTDLTPKDWIPVDANF